MDISYDYYRTFYYVAKNKSFTKAAEQLFAEQPNVTRTVKALEAQLGCMLFYRSKRRVELTPEGEKLFRHVEIALEHIRLGEEEISLNKNLHGGVITVGTSETALYGFLLSVLKNFRTRFDNIRLKVGNYSTKQAISALNEGFVDFAVVTTPLDGSTQFTVNELKTFKEIAVCGDGFSELAKDKISLKEFAEYPIVGLGRSTKTYDFYTEQFSLRGLKYHADIEVATADQLLPMIANDLGIGFVPEIFITENSGVHHIELTDRIPERKICLVRKANRQLSLAAKKLFDEILNYRSDKPQQ